MTNGETWFAEIPSYSPGFSVGVIGDMYMNPYFNLRFTPSIHFGDKKFTLYQKQKAYVLLSKNEIIWVIGERTSDKFRVDGKTTHILEIKCEK